MNGAWWSVILAASLAGVAIFLGMYLVLAREAWSRRNLIYFIAFSGGLMLGIGLLHIFPEAQELNPRAYVYFTIAFVIFYLLEHHLPFHAEHEQMLHDTPHLPCSHNHSCANANPMGMVAFFGMSLHSMIDGMIIGTGFEVDTRVGLLSAIAVVAHKIPAGAAIFSILLHYGWPRRSAIRFTAAVACATPVGAILTFALIRTVQPSLLGILMAAAAGSFVYIAASDLIPESHRARGWKGSVSLIGGILTAAAAGWLAG